jgi:hypothetical protein
LHRLSFKQQRWFLAERFCSQRTGQQIAKPESLDSVNGKNHPPSAGVRGFLNLAKYIFLLYKFLLLILDKREILKKTLKALAYNDSYFWLDLIFQVF